MLGGGALGVGSLLAVGGGGRTWECDSRGTVGKNVVMRDWEGSREGRVVCRDRVGSERRGGRRMLRKDVRWSRGDGEGRWACRG